MPRTARLTYPGGFYHLYNKSLGKRKIFKEINDYQKVLLKLEDILKESDYIVYAYCYAYCFMPTHFHLIGKTCQSLEAYLEFVYNGIDKDLEEFNPFGNKEQVLGTRIFASHRKSI